MERKIHKVIFDIPLKPALKKVAAYARVSTGKETMLNSLSQQIGYYINYIQNREDWIFCGVYADEACTGTKEQRPEFQRMLRDCRNSKIELIITKSISRFARNTVTLLETVRELKQLGIDVYFEEQNIHTLSTEGELMLTILASYAQEESLSASENMKWKIKKCFEDGIPWNGSVIGYRIKDGRYVTVEKEAETVKRIYDLYLSGQGYASIAKQLNGEGIRTRNNNLWTPAAVQIVLHNILYTGNMLLQSTYTENHITKKHRMNDGRFPKYKVENSHEAIIPAEIFNAVQEESARRAEFYKRKDSIVSNGLDGIVFCGKCGKHCRRKTCHGITKWVCNTYCTKGKTECAAKAVPEKILLEILRERSVKKLYLCGGNIINIQLENGETEEYQWRDKSRTESWTPEMRRQQGERRREAWKKNGK